MLSCGQLVGRGIDMRFFRKRGAPTGIKCATCEKENPVGTKYCGHCGLPLDSKDRSDDADAAERITRVLAREYGDRELIELQIKTKVRSDLLKFFIAPIGIIITILTFIGFKSYNDVVNSATNQVRNERAIVATETNQVKAKYSTFTMKITNLSALVSQEYTLVYGLKGSIASVANAVNHYDGQFSSPHLDPTWHWIHGKPSYVSLTVRPGWLRIYTESGKDLFGSKTDGSLLLEKAPTGDYEISTYVQMSPSHDSQQAGIVMYGNDGNFCKVVYVQHRSNTIELGCQGNGLFDFRFQRVTPPANIPGYYLQLDKSVFRNVRTT
jgi:ribosomal protein L37E